MARGRHPDDADVWKIIDVLSADCIDDEEEWTTWVATCGVDYLEELIELREYKREHERS